MKSRGALTEEIKKKSLELLGYEINQVELRLMPYIQYLSINRQSVEKSRVVGEEIDILKKWLMKGYLNDPLINEEGGTVLTISKEFFIKTSELIFMGYAQELEANEVKNGI